MPLRVVASLHPRSNRTIVGLKEERLQTRFGDIPSSNRTIVGLKAISLSTA